MPFRASLNHAFSSISGLISEFELGACLVPKLLCGNLPERPSDFEEHITIYFNVNTYFLDSRMAKYGMAIY